MNELERIVREASQLAAPALLATVVRVSGSSYRRPGARMLVADGRWLAGCVSGGCLEGDVLLRGEHRLRNGPAIVTYDSTTEDDAPWTVGLGCNGVVDVLLERVPNDALRFAQACFSAETSGVLVTVISGPEVGARVAVGPAVPMERAPADPRPLIDAAKGPPGVVERGGHTLLVEAIAPSPQLFVLGSAHDAGPLVTMAQAIGMRVTVADRVVRARFAGAEHHVATGGDLGPVARAIDAAHEAYVVVKHHQVDADRAALEMALASRAKYIGVLGPARRTRDLVPAAADDARVHAPVGLDLGAETPEQIALAIVAELQATMRWRSGAKLRQRARAIHADVATVVLAAGASRRLGRPKQLEPVGEEPLLRRVARACVSFRAGPVGVVLGAHASEVAPVLEGLPVQPIVNEGWEEGMASSIREAVRWAETTSASALVVVLGDQPFVTEEHLAALRDRWLTGSPAVGSAFHDVVGAPAIFDRTTWPELLRLEGDRGASALLRDAVPCHDVALDVDTAEDLSTARARLR